MKLRVPLGSNPDPAAAYLRFGDALRTQRSASQEMVFSCSWPAYLGDDERETTKNYTRMYQEGGCNLWRNWGDIDNNYGSIRSICMHWAQYWQALGGVPDYSWNDADMILAGDDHYGKPPAPVPPPSKPDAASLFGLSVLQARLQLTFWSMVASALFL